MNTNRRSFFGHVGAMSATLAQGARSFVDGVNEFHLAAEVVTTEFMLGRRPSLPVRV